MTYESGVYTLRLLSGKLSKESSFETAILQISGDELTIEYTSAEVSSGTLKYKKLY